MRGFATNGIRRMVIAPAFALCAACCLAALCCACSPVGADEAARSEGEALREEAVKDVAETDEGPFSQDVSDGEDAAPPSSVEDPSGEAPHADPAAASDGFETPYYTIALPDSLSERVQLSYDDTFSESGPGLGLGYSTNVLSNDGFSLFSVTCFTDAWGPQGAFYTVNLGTPTGLEGCHAVLSQGRYGSDGSPIEDRTAEYATYVTLK